MNVNFFLVLIAAYILGSIPPSVWVSRIFYKRDIRAEGSKNAGLTNVFRVLGWKAAVPVTIVDLGKGLFSSWLGSVSSQDLVSSRNFALVTGLLCIFGHSYTCFAGFRGGKGVLAALGVYLYLVPFSALGAFFLWIVVFAVSGYVSLASICAALAMILLLLLEYQFRDASLPMLIMTILLSFFIIYRHRTNVIRLMNGNENRFGGRERLHNT